MQNASSLNQITAGLFVARDFERIIATSSAKSLTATKYIRDEVNAKRAFITVETKSFRYMYHGDNPTSSTGHIARPNSVITIIGSSNIRNFRFIAISGSPVLSITYEF